MVPACCKKNSNRANRGPNENEFATRQKLWTIQRRSCLDQKTTKKTIPYGTVPYGTVLIITSSIIIICVFETLFDDLPVGEYNSFPILTII
jgi:hypothetical protein